VRSSGRVFDWRDLEDLRSGTEQQQDLLRVLEKSEVLELLAGFDPVVVSSHRVRLDLPGSDVDIACQLNDLTGDGTRLRRRFSGKPSLRARCHADSVVVSFLEGDFEIEIFGQGQPVERQCAYRHLTLHARLLQIGGEALRSQVLARKQTGLATEAAMAEALGLRVEDPFEALLEFETLTGRQLRERLFGSGTLVGRRLRS
jgi:hypothetical protein